MKLFDGTLRLLSKAVGLGWMRHGLIASNLANVETPGFVPKDLDFRAELSRAMGSGFRLTKTHPLHLDPPGQGGPLVLEVPEKPGPDGNMVNLEQEAVKLAQNQLLYNAFLRMLAGKFEKLKYTISEGGR